LPEGLTLACACLCLRGNRCRPAAGRRAGGPFAPFAAARLLGKGAAVLHDLFKQALLQCCALGLVLPVRYRTGCVGRLELQQLLFERGDGVSHVGWP
jgi:hypothetical protein